MCDPDFARKNAVCGFRSQRNDVLYSAPIVVGKMQTIGATDHIPICVYIGVARGEAFRSLVPREDDDGG